MSPRTFKEKIGTSESQAEYMVIANVPLNHPIYAGYTAQFRFNEAAQTQDFCIASGMLHLDHCA